MSFNPIRDDPEIRIQRWEYQQAKNAGLTVEQWYERKEKNAASTGENVPSTVESGGRVSSATGPSEGIPILPLLALVFLGVAIFPTIASMVWSVGSTLSRWLAGPLVPALWGALALIIAKALHVLRSKRPLLYGRCVLLGFFAIGTAVGLKLQFGLSVEQALALLGASFGAVDGFQALRKQTNTNCSVEWTPASNAPHLSR